MTSEFEVHVDEQQAAVAPAPAPTPVPTPAATPRMGEIVASLTRAITSFTNAACLSGEFSQWADAVKTLELQSAKINAAIADAKSKIKECAASKLEEERKEIAKRTEQFALMAKVLGESASMKRHAHELRKQHKTWGDSGSETSASPRMILKPPTRIAPAAGVLPPPQPTPAPTPTYSNVVAPAGPPPQLVEKKDSRMVIYVKHSPVFGLDISIQVGEREPFQMGGLQFVGPNSGKIQHRMCENLLRHHVCPQGESCRDAGHNGRWHEVTPTNFVNLVMSFITKPDQPMTAVRWAVTAIMLVDRFDADFSAKNLDRKYTYEPIAYEVKHDQVVRNNLALVAAGKRPERRTLIIPILMDAIKRYVTQGKHTR
jgi:hypothetical protein